jgi:quaternary ammonium compound-resistance protein SugE
MLIMSLTTSWILLIIAGAFEVAWAVGLKYTEGFSRLWPSLITLVALTLSMLLLARAAQQIPIGTAYAVWVGIGALGAAILGIFLFHEPVSPARIFFLVLLLVAILGLKLTGKAI